MKQYFIISVIICFAAHGMEMQDRAPKRSESKSLSVADLHKIFDESEKREHARKLLQNVCPLRVTIADNPELFNRQTEGLPHSHSFFDANNRLLAITQQGENHHLLNFYTGASTSLNTPAHKVFLTHVDQASNKLLVFKEDKTEEYDVSRHKSLLQIVDLASGNTVSESMIKMPYCISKVAYDDALKRVYLANVMYTCMGDFVSLFTIGQNNDAATHVAKDCPSNEFVYLAPLPNQSLITVQQHGVIKKWDFSQRSYSSEEVYNCPLDYRVNSILPDEPIYADLSTDKKNLLVGINQPCSRFFLVDLENPKQQQYFAHDILDTDDLRPITALKLLPNKKQFVAVRAALKKKMPAYPVCKTTEPFDYTVQLWEFDNEFNQAAAPLAEFSIHKSPVMCRELSISADGTHVAANNLVWDISLLARLKEVLKKDLLTTAQEYDALLDQDPQGKKDAKEARKRFTENPTPETFALSEKAARAIVCPKIILPLLKRLDQIPAESTSESFAD